MAVITFASFPCSPKLLQMDQDANTLDKDSFTALASAAPRRETVLQRDIGFEIDVQAGRAVAMLLDSSAESSIAEDI
jgi:hypothetical protein